MGNYRGLTIESHYIGTVLYSNYIHPRQFLDRGNWKVVKGLELFCLGSWITFTTSRWGKQLHKSGGTPASEHTIPQEKGELD